MTNDHVCMYGKYVLIGERDEQKQRGNDQHHNIVIITCISKQQTLHSLCSTIY